MLVGSGLLEPGQLLGDYEIAAVAGVGGMGVVYKARQRSLGRVVAFKVIREEIASLPEYRERFLREARLAASVDHPHVVSVYDVGEADGCLFLAMQWVDGQDLKRLVEAGGRLGPERAVGIAVQLAGALDAVHSVAGLIHRDVKPANVLMREVGSGDHAYLTDFGVAKPSEPSDHLTRTGWVVGTSGYLSPEQIRGQEPGPRSDLYALGCLFFEALTGRPPFRGDNEMALRWAHANDPRPLASAVVPELGARYDRFLAVALAVDPAHRFASGREFVEALRAAHAGSVQDSDAPAGVIPVPHAPTAVGPPTPVPPGVQMPPPLAPGYPAYGYGTPVPPYSEKSRSGNPLALVLLAMIALAGIAAAGLAATGVFSHPAAARTPAIARAASTRHPNPTNTPPKTASTTGTGSTAPSAGSTTPAATSTPQAAGNSNDSTSATGANLASPGAPAVSSPAGAALQQYWQVVNEGHYGQAWAMETPHEQAQEPAFVSDKKAARPMINVASIGQASTSGTQADVPIAFYAQDRYPSPGSDTTCRYFRMTAHMVEIDVDDWAYDGPVSGTAQVTEEPGSPNCHS